MKRILLFALAMGAFNALATPRIDLSDLKGQGPIADLHGLKNLKHALPQEDSDHPRDRIVLFDVTNYRLNIAADPFTGIIEGTATLSIRSLAQALDTLVLDAAGMTIAGVALADSTALDFNYASPLLSVRLKTPLASGATTAVTIRYRADRPQAFHTTGGDVTHPQRMIAGYTYTEPEGSQEWYPCLDRPADKATADITVTVPKDFSVLTNGVLQERTETREHAVFTYRMDQPIATYLLSLAVGQWEVLPIGNFKGKPLTLWTPPQLREAALTETKNTQTMVEEFSKFTGIDYAFPSYSQSIAQGWRTSMEHQSATTMGGWRIMGDMGGEVVVAHELAHQWFGDLVTCRTWGEVWLNEGFASYLPYVYFAAAGKTVEATSQRDYWRSYYDEAASLGVHALSESQPNYDELFDGHAYQKGALVLQLMRATANEMAPLLDYGRAGEETFTTALRQYLTRKAYGTVTSYDLEAALTEVTGRPWNEFFNQWVRSAGHPRLNASYAIEGDALALKVTQTQYTDPQRHWRTFSFPLDVEIVYADGKIQTQRIYVYRADEEFHLQLTAGVKAVAINLDPAWNLPAEISVVQEPAAWLEVLKHSSQETSRMTAFRAINAAGPVSETAVAAVLRDPSDYLKADAIEQMSRNVANRLAVHSVQAGLRLSGRNLSVYTVGSLARTETWLNATSGETPTPLQLAMWQRRFQASTYTEERAQLLLMLASGNLEAAQQFAFQRLQEDRWVTKDRVNLVGLLTKQPTAASEEFIQQALAGATELYLGQTLRNLIAASYQHGESVGSLARVITGRREDGMRLLALDLLVKQTTAKDLVCPQLAELLQRAPTEHDAVWKDISIRASAGSAALGCVH